MLDNRTKVARDIKYLVFIIIGILIGGIGVKWDNWERKQIEWADSQVPMLLSPLGSSVIHAQEAPRPTPQPTERELVTAEITRVFGASSVMHKVAFCESGLNPRAKNKNSSATGIFQIMASVHGVSPRFLTDYKVNIAIAKKLYDEQGTNPWNASINCWSK